MSQTTVNNNSGNIVNSWSLIAFARAQGPRMQVGKFVNKESGDEFHSCIFTNKDGEHTFCAFSHNLGELTSKEIAAQKDDLQVVQMESGHYILCKQGGDWDDVDLGI